MTDDDRSPRQSFRVLTRARNGSGGAMVHDVQLQVGATGALVWSQTFSDPEQARAFEAELDGDLDELDGEAFRRKYGVPSSA